MNKTERLELENKILRGMLSDIRKSIQKLDKASTTSSEERIRETYRRSLPNKDEFEVFKQDKSIYVVRKQTGRK